MYNEMRLYIARLVPAAVPRLQMRKLLTLCELRSILRVQCYSVFLNFVQNADDATTLAAADLLLVEAITVL